MKKNFILDTNVLLHDPYAIHHFEDNNVIIPLKVLEEIDQFKREVSERGRNARQVARMLDKLRERGRLSDGIVLDHGGVLRVAFPKKNGHDYYSSEGSLLSNSADNSILRIALDCHKNKTEISTILITKDINLRLKADAFGMDAEDYENGHIVHDEMNPGFVDLLVDEEFMKQFKQDRKIEPPEETELGANQYIILHDKDEEKSTLLGRYDAKTRRIVTLIAAPDAMQPIKPRNVEQHFAIDALLNDTIKVVTLVGKAGTGKTLLAVAAGVYKVLDEKAYQKLLVSRPTLPMGKDLGFLPGSLQEKLDPWMQPIHDALDLIRHGRHGQKKDRDFLHTSENIEVESLSYIRGRSIPNQFMIVDEAQNLTPLEVKTVITRVGHGTKIVLTGDIYQIDNPYIDSMSNGMNAVVERFRGHELAAHILLIRGVRSDVAELAANVL